MKKILMLSAALCLFANGADATRPFNGWSVGIHGGWNQAKIDLERNDILNSLQTVNGIRVDGDIKFNSGFAGVHFDWTKSRANDLLFGFGLNIGYGFGSPTHTAIEGKNINVKNQYSGTGKVELEQKRKLYGELIARLGWNFDNKWTLYGLVAARAQGVDNKGKITGSNITIGKNFKGSGSFELEDTSKVTYGFAPGAGFDVRINECWSIGAEYKYYFDKNIDSGVLSDLKMRSHNALFRVNYHF